MNASKIANPVLRPICSATLLLFIPLTLGATTPGTPTNSVTTLVESSARALRSGDYRTALEMLRGADEPARRSPDTRHVIDVRTGLGLVHTWTGNFVEAEYELRDALKVSVQRMDQYGAAAILNNLGNLFFAQKRFGDAREHYTAAVRTAQQNSDRLTLAQAAANLAQLAANETRWNDAETVLEMFAIRELPLNWDKAVLFVRAAQTFLDLARSDHNRESSMCEASAALTCALEIAKELADSRMQSLALGLKAQLYSLQGQPTAALALTQRALFQAQQTAATDLVVDWEWQMARLWQKLDQPDSAIAAYERAVKALQSIRHDFSHGYGNSLVPESFHEGHGALYFELADLLLKTSDDDSPQLQQHLIAARETIELLRSAELEDYFRDECVSQRQTKVVAADLVSHGVAVVYLIPLTNRLEVLISRSADLRRVVVAVDLRELIKTASDLRSYLEKRTTYQFRRPAQRLYGWLIEPILPLLMEGEVNTLIWIPVGGLRSIPMAALHDGRSYLVEKYAVGVTPGLNLIDPQPLRRRRRTALLAGLSQPVKNSPALEHIRSELTSVRSVFGGKILLDERFQLQSFGYELQTGNYSLVHIASHAQFDPESRNSFIETHNGRLDLNDLERLIRPSQYRGSPIELLVLSACQTAAGDDRAALGLAGVAVKSGARSALATLWNVNDEATALLLSSFYRELQTSPDSSKAHALRAAQLQLIENQAFRHPFYWSPFILIGNWL